MSTGGRGVWNRKTRVDEARSIDILDLQRKEVFSKGLTWSWTTSWSRNDKVFASISYRVETGSNGPFGLRFMYTITDNETEEKKDYNYIIPVVPPIATMAARGGGLSALWLWTAALVSDGAVSSTCRRDLNISVAVNATSLPMRADSGTGKSFMKVLKNLTKLRNLHKRSFPGQSLGKRKKRFGGSCHVPMTP